MACICHRADRSYARETGGRDYEVFLYRMAGPVRKPVSGAACIKKAGHSSRKRSSKEGHRADALALGADERRDKLRKAPGRGTYPSIRRSLNGETRLSKPQSSISESIGYGREPGELKHLSTRRKRKKHRSRQ